MVRKPLAAVSLVVAIYAGCCLSHTGQEGILDIHVHISEEGVASWDLPDGAQQSLYYEFRVKVVGTGQEDHYLNVVIASVRYYNLSLLRLPPGNYAVQVQAISPNGTTIGEYSKPTTYSVKGPGVHTNLIVILLPVIMVAGIFLGIVVFVFVVRSRSTHITCYHEQNSPKEKSLSGGPVDVEINQAYSTGRGGCKRDNGFLKNVSENDYYYIDSSVHVRDQSCTQQCYSETETVPNHQYEAWQGNYGRATIVASCNEPQCNNLSHGGNSRDFEAAVTEPRHASPWTTRTVTAGRDIIGGKKTFDGEYQNHSIALSNLLHETRVQDKSKSSSEDEYIEVHHKSGTLV